MKTLVVLTGAGVSAESGISTFRDKGGLWEQYDVMEVASIAGWKKNPELVLRFYNERRKQLGEVEPNTAHRILAELEKDFDVQIVTQNVDNLHERAGSTKVLHLHGEMTKARSSLNPDLIIDIGYRAIEASEKAPDGSLLRPHVVWFGEPVPIMEQAKKIVLRADILIVIGTSLHVYPAAGLIKYAPGNIPVFLIDPDEITYSERDIVMIREKATCGMELLRDILMEMLATEPAKKVEQTEPEQMPLSVQPVDDDISMPATIVFGDIHGLTFWKKVVSENPGYRFVFLGDYLDPYGYIETEQLMNNLKEIIQLKKDRPDDVVLLLGNHDLHYFCSDMVPSSRFDFLIAKEASALFRENIHLFVYAYQVDNCIFTHAGISEEWFLYDFKGDATKNIAEQLNNPTPEQELSLCRCGEARGGEPGAFGGIFWADVSELYEPLPGYTQVVGHNRVNDVCDHANNGGRIIFCDCLFYEKMLSIGQLSHKASCIDRE